MPGQRPTAEWLPLRPADRTSGKPLPPVSPGNATRPLDQPALPTSGSSRLRLPFTQRAQTPRTGRRGRLKNDATLVEKMDRKVSNKAGRALYRKRQHLIEPVFGQIKDGRHIRHFMRRGKAAANSEWKLICGTHNLLKLYRRALGDAAAAPYSRMTTGIAC